ncbi:hypothetical protein SAMN04489712_101477 [Thermomonospora echinospora]|uniref:Uncharacterized protein n=1 Tax=Thermomonospora echinospora TaxID=1992 RepID=A0A1H5T4A7_9ACTN|nr:hypothetical protein SAMN04489712_101477 [Thermomonospora echinospora]
MRSAALNLLAECRRDYRAVAGQADVRALRAEAARLMGVLADPAH